MRVTCTTCGEQDSVRDITIPTQHDGLIFLADEAPFQGARYARLDLARRRVVSWHESYPTPAYRECGSHKTMRKHYEAKYGALTDSGQFIFVDGKLFDCEIRTQKKTYVYSLFGGHTKTNGGRKYDEKGQLR
jgi:hypothetical protein